jgi:3',5'-cyclic AMP phosphodiesterase CpdA
MEQILLRFRDTEEKDTIAEHESLIEKFGYTWWGWWRKDSEPERQDLIKKIDSGIQEFEFYLFDRSTERFFYVIVSQLFFKDKTKVKSPEVEKTPDYYSDEQLYMWLKITSFKPINKSHFLEIFEIIPTNDYTFFTTNDIKEELTKIEKKPKRIQLKSDYILHLSDIHFGDDFGFTLKAEPKKRPLLDVLVDYVNNELKKDIGLLIVSGDISSRGDGDVLLDQGLSFLDDLAEKLSIDKEAVVIIPGNHDIPLEKADFTSYNHETIFRIFLRQFYNKEKELFGIDYFQFPCGKTLDVLRMNSVKLRKKEESNYGYVDWYLYNNLLAESKLDGNIKMAVIHHHLVSMSIEEMLDPQYRFGSISVTIDSGRVIEGLQKYGFDFVLNGHQHIPGITTVNRGVRSDKNEMNIGDRKELTILSAGSAGAKNERLSEEMKYNTFSVYSITDDYLSVEVKKYNPGIDPNRVYASKLPLR